jgi:hypothetical protein
MKNKFIGILLAAALAVTPATTAFAAGSSTAEITVQTEAVTITTVTTVEEIQTAAPEVYEAMTEFVTTLIQLAIEPENVTTEDLKQAVASLNIQDEKKSERIETALSGDLLTGYITIELGEDYQQTEDGKYELSINIPAAADKEDVWIIVFTKNEDGEFEVDAVKPEVAEEAAEAEEEASEETTDEAEEETSEETTDEEEEEPEITATIEKDGTISISSTKEVVGITASTESTEETAE